MSGYYINLIYCDPSNSGRSLTQDDATLTSLKLRDGSKLLLMGREETHEEANFNSSLGKILSDVDKIDAELKEIAEKIDNDFVKVCAWCRCITNSLG